MGGEGKAMNEDEAAQSKWAKLKEAHADEKPQQKLEIRCIYVKEQSCKLPRGAAIFQVEGQPDVALEMDIRNQAVTDTIFEVTVSVNVTAKIENTTAYMLEVIQAGLFNLEGFNVLQLKQLLEAHCPDVLFPYLRKTVYDTTKETGFAPCTLSPVNFASIYQQQLIRNNVKQQGDAAQHIQ